MTNLSLNGFWDPEKYFDLMKLAKSAANQIKIKETKIAENNSICGGGDSNYSFENSTKAKINSNEENITSINEINKNILAITDISTISDRLSLNPGSTYEVTFCSLNTENNFHVNLTSLIPTFDEIMTILNEYCNNQQQMYIKGIILKTFFN